MVTIRRTWLVALAGLSGACGGVSEERVAALESQVKELKQQPAASTASAPDTKIEARVAALGEGHKKLEEMMETFGREVSAMSTARPGVAATPKDGAGLWLIVAEALGTEPAVVQVENDSYKFSRAWIVEALRVAVAGKQLPKAAADKKNGGVVLRGIKPKSLFAGLGFANNDVVLEVGGKRTATPAELAAALKQVQNTAAVKLLRKGDEVIQQYTVLD